MNSILLSTRISTPEEAENVERSHFTLPKDTITGDVFTTKRIDSCQKSKELEERKNKILYLENNSEVFI